MARRRHLLAAALFAFAALLPATSASAAVSCDVIVTENGDTTLWGAVEDLTAGQTACVRGTVEGDAWIKADGATLTSEPGQRGHIVGEVVVDAGAAHVTVSDLDLDGSKTTFPTPVILGDDTVLSGNDITNNGVNICVILGAHGHHSNANAERTLITGNRVHDCGTSNNHEHGIYVEHATDTRIIGNEIFDNADRGIQLYPYAVNTEIAGNVIDGNGQGIILGGTGGVSSRGTRIHHNVISNPRLRSLVESWWDDSPVGEDNIVERNCVFSSRSEPIDDNNGGFVARDNLVEEAPFADRAAKDFRITGGPCADILAAGRSGEDLPVRPAAAPTAPAASLPPRVETVGDEEAPLVLALRQGTFGPRTRTVRLHVRLAVAQPVRSYAKIDVRYRGRGWRTVGTQRISTRTKAVPIKVPRRARDLAVRATLLKPGADEVVTFRAPRPKPLPAFR